MSAAFSSRFERGSPDWLADADEFHTHALATMESQIRDALADEGSDVDFILLDGTCHIEAVQGFEALIRQAACRTWTNEQLGLGLRVYVQELVERAARETLEPA